MQKNLRGPFVVAALAAALTLAGCSSGSAPEGSEGQTAAQGQTEEGDSNGGGALNVGYFPLVHTASAVQASEEGYFDDHGLEVELIQTEGSSNAVAMLVSGEVDVVYSNYTSMVLAAQKGLSVIAISGNDIGASDHGIMVAKGAQYTSPADLEGATVAVNTLDNIGTVAVREVVAEHGVDPNTIDFVELPYPNMEAALARGDVDAIWQVEPFQARTKEAGHEVLFKLFSGPVADMPVAGWFTTDEFLEANPELIAAFQEALAEAMKDLNGNKALLVDLVPNYTAIEASVVEAVELPRWDSQIDVDQMVKMSDLMLEHGLIPEAFDATSMIGR